LLRECFQIHQRFRIKLVFAVFTLRLNLGFNREKLVSGILPPGTTSLLLRKTSFSLVESEVFPDRAL
jgi:hypothetical protein